MSDTKQISGETLASFYEAVQPSLSEFTCDEIILGSLFVIYASMHSPLMNDTNEKARQWAIRGMEFVGHWAPKLAPTFGFEHVRIGKTRVH